VHLKRPRTNATYLGEVFKLNWFAQMTAEPTESAYQIFWQGQGGIRNLLEVMN
jgi:hypothetical protein